MRLRILKNTVVLLLGLGLVAGCGQKGPLYRQAPQSPTVDAAQSDDDGNPRQSQDSGPERP